MNTPEYWKKVFGRNLKRQCKKAGAMFKDMSADLNIPKITLTSWSTGRNFPRIESVCQIADYLGCSVPDLVYEHDHSRGYGHGVWGRVRSDYVADILQLNAVRIGDTYYIKDNAERVTKPGLYNIIIGTENTIRYYEPGDNWKQDGKIFGRIIYVLRVVDGVPELV